MHHVSLKVWLFLQKLYHFLRAEVGSFLTTVAVKHRERYIA